MPPRANISTSTNTSARYSTCNNTTALPDALPLSNRDAFARLNTLLQRLSHMPAKFQISSTTIYHAHVSLDPRTQDLLTSTSSMLKAKLGAGRKSANPRIAKEALAKDLADCLELVVAASRPPPPPPPPQAAPHVEKQKNDDGPHPWKLTRASAVGLGKRSAGESGRAHDAQGQLGGRKRALSPGQAQQMARKRQRVSYQQQFTPPAPTPPFSAALQPHIPNVDTTSAMVTRGGTDAQQ